MKRCCDVVLWIAGISCFIVGVVFDWSNFDELRQNDKEIEATGNKACDFALNKYHWIFMTSIICKMLLTILDYAFNIASICTGDDYNNEYNDNIYDTLSLLFNALATVFQAADLLLLVLFSYHCLPPEKQYHVIGFINYEADDAFAGVLGAAGVIFNLTIKRNILTIFKAICCSDHAGKWHKILSCISLFFIVVCVGLAIALLVKLA